MKNSEHLGSLETPEVTLGCGCARVNASSEGGADAHVE
jgi:hypothetical protein